MLCMKTRIEVFFYNFKHCEPKFSTMKYVFVFVISLVFFSFCDAQNSSSNEEIVWKSFTDSASSFNLQYPSNWFLKLTNEKSVFVLKSPEETNDDGFLENINLIVKYLPAASNFTNEQLANASLDGLKKKYPSLVVQSFKKITWLKKDAWEIVYELTQNELPAIIMQKVIYYNERLFVGTYTAQANKKDVYAEKVKEIFSKMSVK